MLLQAEIVSTATDHVFQTSADSVYGTLVGVLFVIMAAMGFWIYKMSKTNRETVIALINEHKKELAEKNDEIKLLIKAHKDELVVYHQDLKEMNKDTNDAINSFTNKLGEIFVMISK